jgi:HEAT repeat protein
MRLAKLRLATLCMLLFVPTVRAQESPEPLPLVLRLIARRTTYPIAQDKNAAQRQPRCFVAMGVELTNTGKDPLEIVIAPEPELNLTGPRPESVRKITSGGFYGYQESPVTLAAGKSYRTTLRSLSYRAGASQYQVLWLEPGEYELQAVYHIFKSGKEATWNERVALQKVKCAPVKLTITEGDVVDYWAKALADRDRELRLIAILNLREMGPAAASAVPALVELCKDKEPDLRSKAAQTLAVMGPKTKADALPALLKLLKDEESDVRQSAITALSRVGPAEKAVASAIVPFLRDANPKLRIAAAEAMRFMPFNGRQVDARETTALLDALKAEETPEVRRNLIATLCHHPRLEVLQALIPYVAGEEKYARLEALYSLGRLAPFLERDRKKNEQLGLPIENAVAALALALKDKESLPHAAYALAYFGADAGPAVLALLDALDDPAHQSKELFGHPRVAIIQSLRGIGPGAKAATRSLAFRAVTDPDWTVRQYAIQALASIGPDAKEAGPALNQAFQDKMDQVRNEVAPALAKIGALDALLDGLNNENPQTRTGVIQALGGMKEKAKQVVPALVKALHEDKHAPNRRSAAYALGNLGGAGPVPALAQALKDTDAEVRLAAADALRSIGADARPAIDPLFGVLKSDPVAANREKAGWALVTINIKGQKKLLSDSNEAVVLPTAYLLGQIGPDAQEARMALRPFAERQGQLGEAARAALRQIDAPR